jgi:hypothetical protein
LREVEGLSVTQLNLLKAIAKNEAKLSSVKTIQTYRLGTSANVIKNKSVLLKADIIDEAKGKASFLDPAFEFWFKKQYFGEQCVFK